MHICINGSQGTPFGVPFLCTKLGALTQQAEFPIIIGKVLVQSQ